MLLKLSDSADVPAALCVIETPGVSEPAVGVTVRLPTPSGGVVSDQVSADVPSVIGFKVVSLNRPLALAVPLPTATMSPWAKCELLLASIVRVQGPVATL